jgi:carboxymethylenebutenolidase
MGYCISKDAQREIIAALAGNEFAEVFTYPGCSHAFARHRGIHFDKDAARLANRRTADFFQRHLT